MALRILRRILKSLLLIVLFSATFLVLDIFVTKWRLKDFHKVSVTKETLPESFPILVVTRDLGAGEYHAKTVLYKNLNAYLAEHQNYTFLVPAGMDEQLNAELRRNSRASREPPNFDYSGSSDPWWAGFKVLERSDGGQYLEVYHTGDDDRNNTSWYEATPTQIYPKYHQQYFGPGVALSTISTSFFVTCGLWTACFIGFKLKKRKEIASPTGTPQ